MYRIAKFQINIFHLSSLSTKRDDGIAIQGGDETQFQLLSLLPIEAIRKEMPF